MLKKQSRDSAAVPAVKANGENILAGDREVVVARVSNERGNDVLVFEGLQKLKFTDNSFKHGRANFVLEV